jgi:hypothetical protein
LTYQQDSEGDEEVEEKEDNLLKSGKACWTATTAQWVVGIVMRRTVTVRTGSNENDGEKSLISFQLPHYVDSVSSPLAVC